MKLADSDRTIGVEIECVMSDHAATNALRSVLTKRDYVFDGCDEFVSTNDEERVWEVKDDSSIEVECDCDHSCDCGDEDCECYVDCDCNDDMGREVTSPPLTWAEFDEVGEVIDALDDAGDVSDTCGGHVHISAEGLSEQGLRLLAWTAFSWSEHILRAFPIISDRKRYCAPLVGEDILRKGEGDRIHGYDGSRYRGINFCSLRTHGTVEFRLFNGTLDATTWRANVLFALGMVEYARAHQEDRAAILPAPGAHLGDDFARLLDAIGFTEDEFPSERRKVQQRLKPRPQTRELVTA